MSKKHYECCQPTYCCPSYGGYSGGMGCGCSFNNVWTLIVLILIVLQFSKKKEHECDEEDDGWFGGLIDNGILFIIAIFLLVFCGCGKGYSGGMGY